MFLTCLTWNIEGLTRNLLDLKHHVDRQDPDLIFLQEPMCFQHDMTKINDVLGDNYKAILNSDDKYDNELPLQNNRAHGGYLTLYKKHLEPFITEIDSSSSRILPILLKMPGFAPSFHFNIYMPTAGKDAEYVEVLSNLKNLIEDCDSPGNIIFVRGDANASIQVRKNNPRDKLFNHFVEDMLLINHETNHNTYHHFTGDGLSDSSIDVLLESSLSSTESVKEILCSKAESNIDSHHDIIVSMLSISIPSSNEDILAKPTEAPRIENNRTKIIWSEEGIVQFVQLTEH